MNPMSMRPVGVKAGLWLGIGAIGIAMSAVACRDNPGFQVWLTSERQETVIVVLMGSAPDDPHGDKQTYVVKSHDLLRQAGFVRFASFEQAASHVFVYTEACVLISQVDVPVGDVQLTVAADGSIEAQEYEGLFAHGPFEAPDLEPAPQSCGG
jgi:hypothetical protein